MSEPPQDGADGTEAATADGGDSVDPRLLELLVCPLTKTTLEVSTSGTELISRAARLAYPIRDGIPLMTPEAARELTDNDLS